MTVGETYEQRWVRRDAKLQERLADIPSRFTNEALYEPAPVGVAVQNAEHDLFGTSFTKFSSQVRRAARAVSYQWPGLLDIEEAEQELWVHLMETPGTIRKLRDAFDDRQRLNALVEIGQQIGNKALTEHRIFMGDFRYSVNQVKQILVKAAEQERDPSLKLLTRSALLDLTRGTEALRNRNSDYTEAISKRYRDGIVPKQGAQAFRLSAALTALTTEMNRAFKQSHAERSDGPGTRKRVSRAAAAMETKRNWDDDSAEAVNRLIQQAKVTFNR